MACHLSPLNENLSLSHRERVGTAQEAIHEAGHVRGSNVHSLLFQLCSRRTSDGSGSIDREEFLQIPQIATNPLASRMIAIFDEEYAYC
jgi:hypothetical protein